MADRSSDWLEQVRRDLEQAEQSMQAGRHEWACFAAHQAVDKALKGLNLACGQQAWGHTLSRLWRDLPEQPWQPEPPADLQDRLWLFDGLSINTHRPRQRRGDQQAPAPQPSRGSRLESQNGFSHQWQERRPTNKKAPTKQGQTNKWRVTSSPGKGASSLTRSQATAMRKSGSDAEKR